MKEWHKHGNGNYAGQTPPYMPNKCVGVTCSPVGVSSSHMLVILSQQTLHVQISHYANIIQFLSHVHMYVCTLSCTTCQGFLSGDIIFGGKHG